MANTRRPVTPPEAAVLSAAARVFLWLGGSVVSASIVCAGLGYASTPRMHPDEGGLLALLAYLAEIFGVAALLLGVVCYLAARWIARGRTTA